MKIKLLGHQATRAAFFASIDNNLGDVSRIMNACDQNDKETFDVQFSINGVELDFQNFVSYLVETYDQIVSMTAMSLISSKFYDITDAIDCCFSELTDKLNEAKHIACNMVESISN